MGSKNLNTISNNYYVKTDDFSLIPSSNKENNFSYHQSRLRERKAFVSFDKKDQIYDVEDIFYQIKSPDQAILELRIKAKNLNRFIAIQKWEGHVEEIYGENITARVDDLMNIGVSEYAQFSVAEINAEDRALLRKGAIFYWNIGYEETSGTRKKVSYIRFRRLPRLSQKDVDRIKEEVKDLKNNISWDE